MVVNKCKNLYQYVSILERMGGSLISTRFVNEKYNNQCKVYENQGYKVLKGWKT